MGLNEMMADAAARCGICAEGHARMLAAKDRDELMRMYLESIDFCLSNDFPSNGFLRDNFTGVMERFGVFVDGDIEAENLRHVVALGSCAGRACYAGYSAGEVYVKHDGRLTVEASGNAFVMVDVFDRAEVTLKAADNARICANRYGGKVETDVSGARAVIRVREKHKNTY